MDDSRRRMLTKCPSCRARASLSDQHAGAKIRCAECGRVHVARAHGARPRRGRTLRLALGALAGILALSVALLWVRSCGDLAESRVPDASAGPLAADANAGAPIQSEHAREENE